MTEKSPTTHCITFTRNGQIKRNGIRVGWIDDRVDGTPYRWKLRFTPASGAPGDQGRFRFLRDAKLTALRLLEGIVP